MVAGFVLAFDFVLRASGVDPGSPGSTPALVRATIDWASFVAATVGVAQKRDAETRTAFGFLLAANTSYLFANYFYSGMPSYHSGDAVDGLWFAAWVLRWAAARAAWHQYRLGRGESPAELSPAQTEYRSSALSYVILACAFVLLMSEIVRGDTRSVGLMTVAAVAMASLLLFRQFAELRLNRRLFEAQLAQEARFRSLVQHSSDVVLVADEGGTITYVSPSAARILGEHAPIRTGVRIHDVVPPEDVPAVAAIFGESDRDSSPLKTRMQTADGEWRDMEVLWSRLGDDPNVRGIVLNCRDVTERNELERRLQHAQKIDAVGHLAGGLAHDFNNLLMVIRGYTELLRGELPPEASAQADLAHMEQAVDRASTVTRKLLAFSRRQTVQPTVLDLNAVLADLQPIFRQLLTDGVEVRLDPQQAIWRVKADQGQIEQVMVNLATNARDAMPHGGVLRIVTANRRVDAVPSAHGGLPPGDYVCLEVTDAGTGMTDTVRARIFEPFFSTKPKDRGIGLGLAMVHGIVTRAGGHITVTSAPDTGTTFTVLLPRTTEVSGRDAESAAPAESTTTTRTVLLVDDEPAVREITRRLLERAGYRVLEAANGHEALAIAARLDVQLDLLLTDMVMPGLHGREVVARFRIVRPGTPVVGITGYAGEADQGAAVGEAGLAGLVTKPFSADALVRAVASACEGT
jgi:two-component system, cell cycle sensor histidine kinase and response regulator CckA